MNFKKTISDIFNLKYFWIYLLAFAFITTLSSIIQQSKIPSHNHISNIISIFTSISMGYLYIMVHNIINKNNLNSSVENFWGNLVKSSIIGLKVFFGNLINILAVVLVDFIFVLIAAFIGVSKHNLTDTKAILSSPLLIVIFVFITIFTILTMLFFLKIMPVVYAENFELKKMFCWREAAKKFFNKETAKQTVMILSFYILSLIVICLAVFGIVFSFNFLIVFFAKTLLNQHYILVSFLLYVSSVLTPFLVSTLHFIVSAMVYYFLADILDNKNLIVSEDSYTANS